MSINCDTGFTKIAFQGVLQVFTSCMLQQSTTGEDTHRWSNNMHNSTTFPETWIPLSQARLSHCARVWPARLHGHTLLRWGEPHVQHIKPEYVWQTNQILCSFYEGQVPCPVRALTPQHPAFCKHKTLSWRIQWCKGVNDLKDCEAKDHTLNLHECIQAVLQPTVIQEFVTEWFHQCPI